jgi:hypothetical protein
MHPAQLARHAALRGAFLFVALASFASAQNQTWIRQFGSGGYDWTYAVAADGSGGVYVSGSTYGSLGGPNAGGSDAWLARYDSTGMQTWIRQLGTNADDDAFATSSDGAGGVYVSGWTFGSLGGPNVGGFDAWLGRYDGAGNQIWLLQIGTTTGDLAFVAAYDGSGGVYVCGYTDGSFGAPNAGSLDAWLAHYNSAGNQTWIRQIGTSYADFANAVASDDSGGVYVSGDTEGSLGGPNPGGRDAWLAHYDSAGTQTWIRQIASSEDDDARAAASDGLDGVYVGGSTRGNLGGPNAGHSDGWLAHYDNAGNQTWIRQFGSTAFADEGVNAVAPDGSGGILLSGFTDGPIGGTYAGGYDAWIGRYDGTGHRIWIQQIGTSSYEVAIDVASDGLGGAFVNGITHGDLGGPNSGGDDAWLARYDGGLNAIRYCTPALPNSTGQPGVLTAIGSNAVQANDVTLIASSLSLHSFGFFLTSRDQGNTFPVSNSQGRLCLGGLIGRYVGAGQIRNSGASGTFSLALDLTAMAHPFNPVVAQPGQTWYFQAWHRDANPTLTSNFTDAVSVTLQ